MYKTLVLFCSVECLAIGGGTGRAGGAVAPQNIRHVGIAPTIAKSHDSDTASPLY